MGAVLTDLDIGGPAGSEKSLTFPFLKHARRVCERQAGTFAKCLESLGMPEAEFDRIVSNKFESFKASFESEEDRVISVKDVNGDDALAYEVLIEVTKSVPCALQPVHDL